MLGGQEAELHVIRALTTLVGCAGERGSDGERWSSEAWRKGVLYVGTTGSRPRWRVQRYEGTKLGGVTVTKGMGQGGLGVTRRLSTGQPWAGEDLRGQASLGKAGAGGGRLLQGLEQEGRADTI